MMHIGTGEAEEGGGGKGGDTGHSGSLGTNLNKLSISRLIMMNRPKKPQTPILFNEGMVNTNSTLENNNRKMSFFSSLS